MRWSHESRLKVSAVQVDSFQCFVLGVCDMSILKTSEVVCNSGHVSNVLLMEPVNRGKIITPLQIIIPCYVTMFRQDPIFATCILFIWERAI